MQIPKNFEFARTQRTTVNYLLFVPKGYAPNTGRSWPLILFLHGAGERGTDVWKVSKHGPAKYAGKHPDWPFIIVSPQCPERQIWSSDILLALLDHVNRQYAVDATRVYLTGLSMGGYGVWHLGIAHPEKFAAIVPICGGGEFITPLLSSRAKEKALQTLPIWAFHGARDTIVPVEESQRMVRFVKRLGVKEVKLTIYPNAEHNSWTETYDNAELYKWLLQRERRPGRARHRQS